MLTFPAEEDHYDGLIDDSHRQASETRWAESPKEEVELVEWMTNAVSQAPWAREARFLPVSPHEPVQVLVRITDEDGYTTRLGIAYCQDDDNQQEFDENFQL